jgi:hypothetical protein
VSWRGAARSERSKLDRVHRGMRIEHIFLLMILTCISAAFVFALAD